MFYLAVHSTHFYIPNILCWTLRKNHRHYARGNPLVPLHELLFYQLAARVLLYAPSHRQDSTYHCLCYPGCGALSEMRNS